MTPVELLAPMLQKEAKAAFLNELGSFELSDRQYRLLLLGYDKGFQDCQDMITKLIESEAMFIVLNTSEGAKLVVNSSPA